MKKALILIVIILSIFTIYLLSSIIKQNNDLNSTEWLLSTWSASSITPNVPYMTLNFKDHKINGNGGVNSFSGDYNIGFDNKIYFKNISSTEIASTDSQKNNAESIYFSLLKNVQYYNYNSNTLVLMDKNKNELLRYEKGD